MGRTPGLNAPVERVIQTLRVECLDHVCVLGERHLRHLVSECRIHSHHDRLHQGVGNVPRTGAGPDPPDPLPFPSAVVCYQRLGGLLKRYVRAT